MAHYLIESSPSVQSFAAMIKNPQDRAEAVRPLIENIGGKLDAYYIAVGQVKIYVIFELPDPVDVMVLHALLATSFATGANNTVSITQLITSTQAVEAYKLAPELGYRPPSAQ